ncbi:MAG TPA: glutamate-5-semialdehyde dehydrogenase [Lachnoclostridium phytofermentans]|uniref:Gamma-glutamyl phosphate reductase n=2 Tax=Lachnoclostridium TaxID=1506553 RepID=A0A3D2X982_9FIRM|nr:glutamate-5-semialdehyde dehydrogenase [Lachnoclostridium sp.]HCL03710.1 glutamate-5-semialdehyde dehydrogenase [Lachnoclostridium phytofermentans]
MEDLLVIGSAAKAAASELSHLGQTKKNEGLLACAKALITHEKEILTANQLDIENAEKNQMKESLIDRLRLTSNRLEQMADGLRQIVSLKDPIGEVLSSEIRPNGLQILKRRVPIGVIGIIYESRPNVTSDAFGLCFKAGNAVVLRGGSDAIHSNLSIVKVLREALKEIGINENAVQLLEDTSRETATNLMKLNEYIDVLIPRGGAGLIKSVVANSTIPVIETGTGNCHVFVDESADFNMALDIIENAKTQRLGVCNACESLVIHENVLEEFLPQVYLRLTKKQIVFRADEKARAICPQMEEATEEDFGTEYLDTLISVKVVKGIEEAIAHINHYNTGHSESIITSDYQNAMKFLEEIDAAAVYVNASTRFTDGEVFGLGAEIGISTQKLHARGPMGLEALTSTKYVVFGNGQIRP